MGLPADVLPDVASAYIESERLTTYLDSARNHEKLFLHDLLSSLRTRVERIPRPFLNLGFKRVASYHFFGILGIVTASALVLVLAYLEDLSIGIVMLLQLSALVLTGIYYGITRLLTRKDKVVFFNYFLTLVIGEVLILYLLDQPVIRYLDVLVAGSGMLFAFGRIGCYMAGCCYGKPAKNGLCYSRYHTRNGFPHHLLHVRLLPVQLIEAAWLFGATGLASLLLTRTTSPGIAVTTFVLFLCTGRILLEFLRGDPERPYYLGISQAQWTSLAVLLGISGLQLANLLPFPWWQSFIYLSFFVLLLFLLLNSRSFATNKLYSPDHIYELIKLLQSFNKGITIPSMKSTAVHIKKTSANLQISRDTVKNNNHFSVNQVSISSINSPLQLDEAAVVSGLIQATFTQEESPVLIVDTDNIYHLIHLRTS